MAQRGIFWPEVRDTLREPETVRPNRHGHEKLDAVKTINGRTYTVVHVWNNEGEIEVVTVLAGPR
jgi:hypothetical protein